MLSIFAGLNVTALADYGRVPYVRVTVTAPSVGAKPVFESTVSSQYENQVYNSYLNKGDLINGVDWYDVTAGKYLGRNDTFVAGHEYTVGVLVTCGTQYRFKQAQRPDWQTVNGNSAHGDYYMEQGYMDNEMYYYILYTFEALPKSGWVYEGNNWYFYKNNVAQKGWVSSGGKWYFMDKSTGAMKTGWVSDGGKWYFMNSNGAMATGWVKSSGKWYFMQSSGAMATGWVKSGGKWYLMQSSGAMATGWIKSGGKWYYMESSGAMLANTSKKINGKTYKFNSSGVCTNP